MDARIARLESDVGHTRSDIAEIKADQRSMRDRMDENHASLIDKIDGVKDSIANLNASLTVRIDGVKDTVTNLNTSLTDRVNDANASLTEKIVGVNASLIQRIDGVKVWALALYIALAGALFGTLARGFGWI